MKFDPILPVFVLLWAPVPPPLTPIFTTSEALVLRVMHTKYGQNWSITFRGNVTERL